MATCGICGNGTGISGTKLRSEKAWLCSNCVKKAGGIGNISIDYSLEFIKDIIENPALGKMKDKYEAKKQKEEAENQRLKSELEGSLFYIQGVRGRSIIVYEDRALIKTKAGFGSLITGNVSDGEKTIYYSDCIGVQFKERGKVLIGYLQFETATSAMNNRNDNFFNENSFTFDLTTTTNEKMREVYEYVQGRIREIKNGNNIVSNMVSSGADEIKKYKELLDSGIITQEEFDAKKKQILGL